MNEAIDWSKLTNSEYDEATYDVTACFVIFSAIVLVFIGLMQVVEMRLAVLRLAYSIDPQQSLFLISLREVGASFLFPTSSFIYSPPPFLFSLPSIFYLCLTLLLPSICPSLSSPFLGRRPGEGHLTPMSSSYSTRGWSHQSSPGVIGQERDFLREGGPLLPNTAYGLRGEGHSPRGMTDNSVHHNVVSTERIRQG